MGKALADAVPAARRVFQEVDDALGERLSTLMWDGPDEELTRTRNAQPALMAVSIAALRALEAEGTSVPDHVSHVAGHSLGEYSALTAAGSLALGETARLLRLRGEAMQKAVPLGVGAMAALLGLDLSVAREVAAEATAGGEICEAANDNAPGQVVVSGHKAAVERAVEIAKGRGARRAMLLSVSAPFHCALMQPAADTMAEALLGARIAAPVVPVVTNVGAAPTSDPEEIRRLLVEQVTGMVRWRESMAWLAANGVTRLYEIGSGRVLSGLAKRIAPELLARPVGNPDEATAAAMEIKEGEINEGPGA